MAIQTATNPQTGERVALIDGQWQPFTQSATNAQGQKAFLIGGEWITEGAIAPAPSKERTFGEAIKDIGAGAVSGAGALVQLPGQLYGLATGDMSETGALGLGKEIQKYGEEMKSAGLKAREQERAQKIAEASKRGEFAAFGTALGETLKDPGLLLNFLAEQAPQLVIPFGAGKLGAGAARLAGAGAKAAEVGTGAAVGAGAVAQGADIGAGTYEEIYKELISKGVDPDQAKQNTINLARAAGAAGGVLSVLANMLPGSRQLERIAAGAPGKGGKIATAGKAILGEIPSENIEEGGGKLVQNVAMQQVKPEQRLTEGLGETAAMATIGAAGMGTAAGALSRRAPEVTPPEEEKKPEAPAEVAQKPQEEPTITPPVSLTGRTGAQLLQDQIRGEQNVGLLDAARVRGEEQEAIREQERQAKEKEQARLDQEERDRQAAMLASQERARGLGLEGNAAANAQLLEASRRRAADAEKQRAKEEADRVKNLEAQKEAERKQIESTVYSTDPLINARRQQDALADLEKKYGKPTEVAQEQKDIGVKAVHDAYSGYKGKAWQGSKELADFKIQRIIDNANSAGEPINVWKWQGDLHPLAVSVDKKTHPGARLIGTIYPGSTFEPEVAQKPKTQAPKSKEYIVALQNLTRASAAMREANRLFDEGKITKEQLDKLQAQHDERQRAFDAEVAKDVGELNEMNLEALRIADELEKLGQGNFAAGLRSSAQRNQVKSLDFYKQKLDEVQKLSGKGVPQEKQISNVDTFFTQPKNKTEPAEKIAVNTTRNANANYKSLLDQTSEAMQALTDIANKSGLKIESVGTNAPQNLVDVRGAYSGVTGAAKRFITEAYRVINNDKRANQKKLENSIAELSKQINAANELAAAPEGRVQPEFVEAEPVKGEAAPRPPEVEEADKTIEAAEAAVRKQKRESQSLWTALRYTLTAKDVSDISTEFNFKQLQGDPGVDLSTLVADKTLDEFLPPKMRSESSSYDEQESTEYIKEKLRSGNYLTHDAEMAVRQLFDTVENAEGLIKQYLEEKDVNLLLQEIADEQRTVNEPVEATATEGEGRVAEPSEGEEKLEASNKGLTYQPDPELLRVQNELKGKSLLQVSQWSVDNAPNSFVKLIAEKVQRRLREMERRGVKFEFKIHEGPKREKRMRDCLGVTRLSWGESAAATGTKIAIELNGAPYMENQRGYPPGVNYTTVMHELLHAATRAQLRFLSKSDPLVAQLKDLFGKVKAQVEIDRKAGTLPNVMKEFLAQRNNALDNIDELVSWGLTDNEMQQYLDGIEVGKKSAFTRMIELIREVIGIGKPYETALERLARTTEDILDVNIRELEGGITSVSVSYGPGKARRPTVTGEVLMQKEGADQTKTNAFKKWFSDSKVVDENGEPLVVYHGTGFDFNVFEGSKKGTEKAYFFSQDPELASSFATTSAGAYDGNANVIPAYIRMENPLIVDYKGSVKWGNDALMKQMLSQVWGGKYDGVIAKNVIDGYGNPTTIYAVIKSNQIKSAIGNRGTFSLESPDILESKKLVSVVQKVLQPKPAPRVQGVAADLQAGLDKVFGPHKKETIIDRIDGMRDRFWQRLAQGVADQYRTIKEYSQEAYMMARMSKTIDGALEGLMFHGEVFNDNGALNVKAKTKGLLDVLKPLGNEVENYMRWVALNREAQLVASERNPSIDPELVRRRNELIQGSLNGKPRAEVYADVLKDMNRLNKSVLKVAFDNGLIDDKGYDRFSQDLFYIPFYKVMEDGDISGAKTASGLTRQEFSKMLKGGEKQFSDLMENTLRNWSHILSASMKNQAANASLQAAQKLDAAERLEGKEDGAVRVMEDGQPVYYAVKDPLLLDAITSIGYMGPKSKFLDVARDFKNMLQFGVTVSPAFKIRNLIRDSVSAMAISDLKKNPVANVIEGINLSDKSNPQYISALAGGAIFNFGSAYEGQQAKMIKRLLDMGVKENQILDTPDKIKKALNIAWDKYQDLGNKSEAANRMALYKQMRDKGMSHLEASFAARDLLDFSMQGSFPAFRFLTQVVPFLNARVQGLYKLGKDGINPTVRVIYNTATGKPIDANDKVRAQSFSIVTAAVGLASIALYAAFKDDEEFKKRDDWDRDNFWWFRLPGMDYAFRIPKPFEIGAFGTLIERSMDQIYDQGAEGKDFVKALERMVTDTFAFNLPQVIKPMVDIYANRDSFTGSPIESAGMERLSKAERITDNTSPLAIALGGLSNVFLPEKMELSPVQVDYLIKGYFGWMGAQASWVSHYAVMPFQEGTKPDNKWTDTMSAGFVRSLPATQSRYVNAFYENSKEISQAYADMRHYAEIGDSAKVEQLLREKGDKIAMAKFYDKTAKDMSEMRKAIRAITADPNMDGAQKREEVDRIKILIGMLAEQAEAARKSMKR